MLVLERNDFSSSSTFSSLQSCYCYCYCQRLTLKPQCSLCGRGYNGCSRDSNGGPSHLCDIGYVMSIVNGEREIELTPFHDQFDVNTMKCYEMINPEGKLTPVYDPLGKLPESRTTHAPPFHCNWGSSILSAADKDLEEKRKRYLFCFLFNFKLKSSKRRKLP